jgi:major vault protein
MIYGPCEYIPPIEVKVVETRKMIQLAENQGIYVRDTKTGVVESRIGKAYMLKPHEELYEMELIAEVEWLLGQRIKTEVLMKEV